MNRSESPKPADVTQRVVTIGLGRLELWDLMFRRNLVAQWLGVGSFLPSSPGDRLVLSDAAGSWRRGRIVSVSQGVEVSARMGPAEDWPVQAETCLFTLKLVEVDELHTQVEITEVGPYVSAHGEEIAQHLERILDRLASLVRRVSSRRNQPRQAYILIHGIGEQEPGRTLMQLVESGVLGSPGQAGYIKPDLMSDSFELRKMTFSASDARRSPTTDVYELYWAHMVRDTTVSQVAEWVRRLMLRTKVPRPLIPGWLLLWAVFLALSISLAGVLVGRVSLPQWLTAGGLLLGAAVFLWRVAGREIVTSVIGDAARYLSPRPANVIHRQAIRQAGVDLVTKLHRTGDYDRLVIIGHSLGSVIAYDIITYAWIQLRVLHRSPRAPAFKDLVAVDRAIAEPALVNDVQAVQHAAWRQIRRNTQPWLVTDLVTLGSPLTYASFLTANSEELFATAKRDRILPTCPPQTEAIKKGDRRRCTYDFPYTPLGGRRRGTYMVFNHGAPFAVTRWTNLYFKSRWFGLGGDIVGGAIKPQLGNWVRDVELPCPVRRFAHTLYWRSLSGKDWHLSQLRQALSPESGMELRDLARDIPAYSIAEDITRRRP